MTEKEKMMLKKIEIAKQQEELEKIQEAKAFCNNSMTVSHIMQIMKIDEPYNIIMLEKKINQEFTHTEHISSLHQALTKMVQAGLIKQIMSGCWYFYREA